MLRDHFFSSFDLAYDLCQLPTDLLLVVGGALDDLGLEFLIDRANFVGAASVQVHFHRLEALYKLKN